MTPTRRRVLGIGGALTAALSLPPWAARGETVMEVVMGGRGDGSRVWFDPVGLLVRPGATIRWINRDPGNAHTATAYHPANGDRPRRIPAAAEPWDSDYLLPGDTFSVTFTVPGVYDYCCLPHEHAGMVGRIVVGGPGPEDEDARRVPGGVPEAALRAFPSITDIMMKGAVRPG